MKSAISNDPILIGIVVMCVLVILAIVGYVMVYVRGSKSTPLNKPEEAPVDMELMFLQVCAELYVTMEEKLHSLAKHAKGGGTLGKIMTLTDNTTKDWVFKYKTQFPDRIPEDFSVRIVSVHNGVGKVSYPPEFEQHIRACKARGLIARK